MASRIDTETLPVLTEGIPLSITSHAARISHEAGAPRLPRGMEPNVAAPAPRRQAPTSNEPCTPQLRYDVYFRAGGRCECKVTDCAHHGALGCEEPLVEGDWDLHRKMASGPYALRNVTAMCSTCLEARPAARALPDLTFRTARQETTIQSSAAWVVQVSMSPIWATPLPSLRPEEAGEPTRLLEPPGRADQEILATEDTGHR